MAQGYVNQFGSGFTYSGSGLVIPLQQGPTINQPNLVGVTDASNAAAGSVGEYISSSILVGSAVSLTTATFANITSISLTAGDWDVAASFITAPNAATVTNFVSMGITQVSATPPTLGAENNRSFMWTPSQTGANYAIVCGPMRINLSATTTFYLIGRADFTVNTNSGYGFIGARRVR